MTFPSDMDVLVVALGETIGSALARSALRHGWPVVRVSTATEGLRVVRRGRPHVVIVQVSSLLDDSLELIRLLRSDWQRVPLIAVGCSHHNHIERAVRGAGASCYLPGSAGSDLLDRAVAALLDGRSTAAPVPMRPNAAAAQDRVLSSSFPPPKVQRAAGSTRPPPDRVREADVRRKDRLQCKRALKTGKTSYEVL